MDVETINADLPTWLHYSSMDDRIATMADPLSLPGELEITATSKVLDKVIPILTRDDVVVQRYGEGTPTDALIVQFTSVGQDFGHYYCIMHRGRQQTPRTTDNIR